MSDTYVKFYKSILDQMIKDSVTKTHGLKIKRDILDRDYLDYLDDLCVMGNVDFDDFIDTIRTNTGRL